LKAAWLAEEAREGAAEAFSITISWSGEPVMNAAVPSRATARAALHCALMSSGNSASTAASAVRPPNSVPRSEWSARRPPTRLPIVAPTPNRARSRVTLASA
jgi:hypothetical protein